METKMELTREVMEALGAAFPEDEIEFLPRGNWEGKARALAYIDARSVMRRLDAVVGPGNWSFDFELLSPDGKMVKGKLTVLGVTKCDAGEGSSEDEVLKSAVSDALKRTAVHFGIGRYLYYLPSVWAAYDQRKRQFAETPRIQPAAVEKALAICGIPTTNLVLSRPQNNPRPAPMNGGGGGASNSAERKSIWNVGGGPGRDEAPASTPRVREATPESSGDRAASAPRINPVASAPTAPPVAAAAPVVAPAAPAADGGTLACSRPDCSKPLTKGQHDVSVRAFGQPLCPACQKQQARAAA
jgi:hypothetical protein